MEPLKVSLFVLLHRNLRIGPTRDSRFVAAVGLATLLAFFAYIARLSDVTHDAFHEMALFRIFAESGVFPLGDMFAFTPTVYPTVHHEWGTGLVLYLAAGSSPLGLNGMAVLRMFLVVAIALTLYRVARNNGANPLLVCLCAPILFPLLWVGFATLRAQIFTLLFMLLQMLMQQSDWRGGKAWIVPWAVLYVVWLNMHAGFVVGVAMLLFHVLERWLVELAADRSWEGFRVAYFKLWHHLLLIPIISVGWMINPWGLMYAPYLVRAINMPRPTMLEWQPLWMTYDRTTAMSAFAISILALGYVAKNRHWSRLRGWLFCCVAAYMALKHLRHGSIYAIVWMAMMPGWLTPTAFGRCAIACLIGWRTLALKSAAIVSIACAGFVCFYPVWQASTPANDPDGAMVYPVNAVKYLKENRFAGNLMTPFSSGAYVSWMCYPQIRVSIDGRYEVAYREDVLPKHNRFYAAEPGWENVLREYNADLVLVQANSPVRKRLGQAGTQTEGWKAVYEDSVFALFANELKGTPVAATIAADEPHDASSR